MHVILWRYRARPGHEADFEAAYGDNGKWARLFGAGEGFLGTELMRGTDGTYLTIDRWASEAAHATFREAQAARYAEMDARCALLTTDERLLGAFEV